ncbi:hypothetical protein [Mangrovibacillus cuniculi]|uniref:Uncharacterized protein n=1 Tax=Mangrovibacillus cuniculi TaxID=2593652 RepID=A0A7S8HEB8_9BACI|nr:hypothetical protein [Mangrovibacillus cuniculi]QPC45563.1 hypothetical protein G8O30_00515 [Mangrovibacillus cuniculi]
MYWKLRIPLLLFLVGATSGLFQLLGDVLGDVTYLLSSILYIGFIGILFTIFEKTHVNEKKVHFSVGIALVAAGVLVDYFLR